MFTPKNIQGALEELYDLCDPDYMVDMLVNYSEEFDDIPSPSGMTTREIRLPLLTVTAIPPAIPTMD